MGRVRASLSIVNVIWAIAILGMALCTYPAMRVLGDFLYPLVQSLRHLLPYIRAMSEVRSLLLSSTLTLLRNIMHRHTGAASPLLPVETLACRQGCVQ